MTRFILTKLGWLAATLFVASAVIFLALELLPGDVARYMMGVNADPAAVAALRAELRLDEPMPLRYVQWAAAMVSGDFGVSYTYRVPAGDLILRALGVSIPLALLALALTLAVAIPTSLLLAENRDQPWAGALLAGAQLGVAMPSFWLGLVLLWAFAINLQMFPAGGSADWRAGPIVVLWTLTLPALALAAPQAAILTRVLRSTLLEAMGEDYFRTARAKGLTIGEALRRHAAPNAFVAALPIMALQTAFLIVGAVIVENVFYIQGIGRLMLQAVAQRDLVTVRATMIVMVFAVVTVMFIADIIAGSLDPRLSRSR
jgi:peptide/nickel transport system permease protein